jgi:PKD repeat protein
MKTPPVISWLLFRVPVLIVVLLILAGLVARAADYVILVDTSGSMTEHVSAKDKRVRIEVVQQALNDYLPALPLPSRVYLMAFNSGLVSQKEIVLATPEDLKTARAWVAGLKGYAEKNGGTHLWTSLRAALKKASDYSQQNAREPVVVRVLTDGEDNENVSSLERVLKEFPLVDGEHIQGNLVLLGDLEIRTKLALPEGAFETTKSVQWNDLFPPVILTIPAQPKAGEEVRFVENTKSIYSSYAWLVDGQPASGEKVLTWRFTDTKPHRVVLKVKGLDGRSQSSVVAITVAEKPAFAVELMAPANALQPKEKMEMVARPTDKAARYRWEINGAEVGTQPTFTWEPTREGDYTITVSAWDFEGREASQAKRIVVAEVPLALRIKGPEEAASGQGVQFVAEIAGPVETVEWDFGDNSTSALKDPLHTFNLKGNTTAEFPVTVRAVSPAGHTARSMPHVVRIKALAAIPPPVADFTVLESQVRVGDVLHLVNTSRGEVEGWQWEISGEISPTDRDPAVHLVAVGEKTVTLTVRGPGGVNSTNRKLIVAPRFTTVVVAIEASANVGKAPFRVRFVNRSTGDVRAWRWDFGDGQTSIERSPEHEYRAPGEFTVKVRAFPADPDAPPVEKSISIAVTKPWPLWAKAFFILGLIAVLAAVAVEMLRRRRKAKLRLPVFYWPHDSNVCQRIEFTSPDESREIPALQIQLRRVGATCNLIAEARPGAVFILPDGQEENTRSLASGALFTVRLSTGGRKIVAVAIGEKPRRPQPAVEETAMPSSAEPDSAPIAAAAASGADTDWGWDRDAMK